VPEIEITGKTIEEAINKGLAQLGCERKDAEIKILDEGSSGLFGLMGAKPARVLISVSSSKCSEQVQISEKESEADVKKIRENVETILKNILNNMGIEFKEISSSYENKTVNAQVSASNGSFIIGKNGQTLDALEYIIQIIANNDSAFKIKVNIDCENYRIKQTEKLKILADKAVEYVIRTGKIYRFDPMGAKERKIIHTYLENNSKVETFSEGEGAFRKVGVKAVKS